MAKKAKSRGCRPDTVVGPWAMNSCQFDDFQVRVIDALGRGEFKMKSNDDDDEETSESMLSALPYVVDNKGVAHISLTGPLTKYPTSFSSLIGGTSMLQAQMAFKMMAKDDRVKCCMIHADSPGGTVVGTAELVESIKRLDQSKPVVTHINGMGASGMYWIASATRWISASPTSEIGSVGAVRQVIDRSGNLEKQGIKTHVITNTGAEKKGLGAEGVEFSVEAKAEMERRLNDLVKPFQVAVAESRGLTTDQTNVIFKAGIYEATPALANGLIDSIDFEDDAVGKVHEALAIQNSDIFARGQKCQKTEPVAPRSIDMKFTPEQVRQVQQVPGCSAVTDESPDSAGVLVSTLATSMASLATMKTENESLKAKLATAPVVPDEASMQERIQNKTEKVDILLEKNKISKVQADTIKASIKADPITMLCAPAGKKSSFDVMVETFSQGTAKVTDGEKTDHQPQPNDPLAPENKADTDDAVKFQIEGRTQGKSYADERIKQLEANRK